MIFGMAGPVFGGDLRTVDGRVYREVSVTGVDSNGVYIRHARGRAKVDFENLSEGDRRRWAADPGSGGGFEKRDGVVKTGKGPRPKPGAAPAAGRPSGSGGFVRDSQQPGGSGGLVVVPTVVAVRAAPVWAGTYGPCTGPRWHWPHRCGLLHWRQRSLHSLLMASGILPRRGW